MDRFAGSELLHGPLIVGGVAFHDDLPPRKRTSEKSLNHVQI
jgi:hypothetical protein